MLHPAFALRPSFVIPEGNLLCSCFAVPVGILSNPHHCVISTEAAQPRSGETCMCLCICSCSCSCFLAFVIPEGDLLCSCFAVAVGILSNPHYCVISTEAAQPRSGETCMCLCICSCSCSCFLAFVIPEGDLL